MKDFFANILNYPKYLIVVVIGLFTFALQPLGPFLKRPITAIALISAFVSSFMGLYFTLTAMLGR
jgi:hypothetical protein